MKKYNYAVKAIKFDKEGLPSLEMNADGVCHGENKSEAENAVRKAVFKNHGMYVVRITTRVAK